MVWEGVEGVASPVEERVGGVEDGVESVGLSVGEGVDSWVSSCIFYFSLFVYVLCNFLPRSCLLKSFVTFCDVLSMFILRVQRKRVGTSMEQFLNILSSIQPGRR